MTVVSKNVYFVFGDNFNKYNNTYHNSIKINPANFKSGNYAGYNVDSNAKEAKL